jgi:hypothetical protein
MATTKSVQVTPGVTVPIDPILVEAQEMREHEEKLAKIEANKQIELRRYERDIKEHRRNVFGVVGGIFIAAALIAVLTLVITWNVDRDRQDRQERQIQDREIAEICIQEGNIWINGDCLLTQRS